MPPSLLLLSRTLYLPDQLTFGDRLRTIVQSLPEELGEQTKQKLTELEGGTVNPKERLALIRSIEEGLKKEREEAKEQKRIKKAEKEKLAEQKAAEQAEAAKAQQAVADAKELLQVEKPAEDTAKRLDVVLQDAHQAVAELQVGFFPLRFSSTVLVV